MFSLLGIPAPTWNKTRINQFNAALEITDDERFKRSWGEQKLPLAAHATETFEMADISHFLMSYISKDFPQPL